MLLIRNRREKGSKMRERIVLGFIESEIIKLDY